MNIWKVLGIQNTKDKEEIKNAYREKLVAVNPEENQKGFMELRQAYEEALKSADEEDAAETNEEDDFPDTPVGNWMRKVSEVYRDINRRRDIAVWKELLEDDVCFGLETKTEARDELLRYLMEHNYLPQAVWKLLDEKFMLQEYREELYELFPVDYINRGVIDNILYEEYIKFDGIESRGGTEYDKYLKLLYNLNYYISGNQLEEAESLFDEIKELHIYHPYEELFYANYLIRTKQYDEAEKVIQPLSERYPDNIEIIRGRAALYVCHKNYEEAKRLYERILVVKPVYYNVLVDIGNTCFELEEYEEAKEYFDRVSDIHRTEYIQERYMDCVNALEKIYEKKHSEEPDNIEYIIEYARAKYQQGNFDESLELLEHMEPDEANRIEYMHLTGCNYMYKENYDKAQDYLEQWIAETEKLQDDGTAKTRKAMKRLSRAYQCMARNMAGKNLYEEADRYLEKALATGEHTTEFYEDRARCFLRQKKYDEAIRACDKIFENDENSVMGHAIRGSALKELCYYRDAIEEWNLCVRYEPYNLMYYIQKIEVLFLAQEYDEIKETIRYLEENGVNEPVVHRWAAAVEGKTGDYNKALEMLTKLIGENEHCEKDYEKQFLSDLYFEVSRISLNNEDNPDKAMSYLDKALEYNPANADALNYKGWILYKSHRYEEAVEVYKKLIEEKPAHFNAFGIMGEIHEEQKEYEKAIEFYTKQIAISQNSYLYMSRGYCYASLDRFEEARADYRRSVELEPQEYNSYRNLANTYAYEEQEEKALPYYEKALEADVEHVELWCYTDYAMTLERMGNVEKAIEVLEDANQHCKSDTKLWLKFARAYCMAGRYEKAEQAYMNHAHQNENGKYEVIDRWCECLCLMGREKDALDMMGSYFENPRQSDVDEADLKLLEILIKLRKGSYLLFKSDMKKLINWYLKQDMGDAKRIILLRYVSDLRKYPAEKVQLQSKMLEEVLQKFRDRVNMNPKTKRSYSYVLCERAVIAMATGNLQEALNYAEQAIQHRKCYSCDFCKCADGLFIKAVILELMGSDEEALTFYELTVQYDKTDFFYRTEYERMKQKVNKK